MPFIGTQPDVGGYSVLDNLTASATASYTLQKDSANFTPSSANQLLVSLNGVIQKPGTSFTISGSTLTFSSALTSSDNIDFILAMGEPLLVGTPSDGAVNTAQLANDAVTGDKIENNPTIAGQLSEAGKEYFQAVLTSSQTGLSDNSSHTVNFASNGIIKYDTKSKWDSSNNAYEFDSATGLYLISMSAGIRSTTIGTESIYDAAARIQFSDDNFSSTITTGEIEFGAGARITDDQSDGKGSAHFSNQSIYKNTTAGRKIRLQTYCNTDGAQYAVSDNINVNIGATYGSASNLTFLQVVRIG